MSPLGDRVAEGRRSCAWMQLPAKEGVGIELSNLTMPAGPYRIMFHVHVLDRYLEHKEGTVPFPSYFPYFLRTYVGIAIP